MRLQETSLRIGNTTFRYHYLCHYLPLASGIDTISRSLMKFKRGAHPDLEAWIDCAREALAEKPPPRDTILLRALGHRETTAQPQRPSPLDHLCQTLSVELGCRYLPNLLTKSRPTAGNKGLSRTERQAELRDVYSADLTPLFPSGEPSLGESTPPPILLIDDILTTGATIRSIVTAVRQSSPACPIQIFTLARGTQDPLRRNFTPLHGRNYHLSDDSGWTRTNTI